MPRAAYHHGDLHQQAHDQALAVLRLEGDSAISLRAIAKQIGVSAPALYRHYADRESLLAELAISGFAALRQQLLSVDQHAPRAALIGIGLAYVAFAQSEPNLYRLMFGGRVLPKGAHPRLDQAGLDAFNVLQDTIARGQRAGYLKPAPLPLMTATAWSLVHGLSQLTIDGHLPNADAEPQLAEGITSLLLEGAITPTHPHIDNNEDNP
ncbi:TetR/AcrR family transcriptional regulator [Alcanivorax sp.]|uniref:TetR/AcrR family transcriptional regulator n=1 Tax=Alcanivorax sp. TaxID=1872427 RepID=UPI000C60B456|nr:TetR/AcrR family transcriptional regulator [Alcanivorax sp.]MBQ26161.1 TetR family transcriptional regulator [Alcanivorax sp.]|tara:strand:+ start:75 stop:701 length:627 start_codon:yes stop_codon:yes gene_type:complete